MKLKIKVTKDVLEQSKMCGEGDDLVGAQEIGKNCAIAVAINSIFPNTRVANDEILFYKTLKDSIQPVFNQNMLKDGSPLPEIARRFIIDFDRATPDERVKMPELEFEIDVPDVVIDTLNIDDVKTILKSSPTMELIEG